MLRLLTPTVETEAMTALAIRWSRRNPWGFLGVSAVLWWSLYQLLAPAAEALVVALPVTPESRL